VTLLFVLVMTVFPAVTVWLYLKWKNRLPWYGHAILFASIWALGELARGKIMGGFPWALVGYSQTTDIAGALAPWVGVYGIGFLILLVPNLLADVVRSQWSSGIPKRVVAIVSVALLCAGSLVGLVKLDNVVLSEPVGEPLRVRLVQANIPQELKFSQERLVTSLEQYTSLSTQDLPPTDLVIWPETAIPTYFSKVEEFIAPFAQELRDGGSEVLSGGFYYDGEYTYNSVRQLGGEKALYKKRHLVPFGEYMPFRFLLSWLAAYIEIPMSDLGAGDGPNLPMTLHGVPIGLTICYEDVFGEEMRELIPAATLMVNVSNDAWFGEKIAPYQHQEKAQMRARELLRPLVRVTNTGVSSVIDHKGNIMGSIAHNTQGFLDATVQPRTGTSFFARTGNWPLFLLSILVVFITAMRRFFSSAD